MTADLHALVAEYVTFRVARGLQPSREYQRVLTRFVDSLPSDRDDGLVFNSSDASSWVDSAPGTKDAVRGNRLSMIRGFARYVKGCGIQVEVPGTRRLRPSQRRAVPYIYTDAEITALMDCTGLLFRPLRAVTMTTLIGLLATTGMRIGETLKITIGDVDLDAGTIRILHAKFSRQRVICIDPSTCRAVSGYLSGPERSRLGEDAGKPLLVTGRGTGLSPEVVHSAFTRMRDAVLRVPRDGAAPRLHDLRHTFATRTMIDAYQAGHNPDAALSALSIWLGHSSPVYTYWYLQAVPDLAAVTAPLLALSPTDSGPR